MTQKQKDIIALAKKQLAQAKDALAEAKKSAPEGSFSAHLKKYRKTTGMTLEEFFNASGLYGSVTCRLECGGADNAGLLTLTRYAHACGVPLSKIFREWEDSQSGLTIDKLNESKRIMGVS